MELNDYQTQAMSTCMASSENLAYMMLNLVGEVGEFASKIAKAIRKNKIEIFHLEIMPTLMEVEEAEIFEDELKKEAGDIAWQLAGLCHVMGWPLEEVCQMNLDKLKSRQQRGVIDGNGDNR